ncbi:helix-turn-helix domain-containing protein [Cellulomonas palmilytica]|uniref:helix-turn-helix domain-containing protein n=1 Tax=Cellulomonas palmilytica TaxID=2608402 RepID=UPI001F1C4329|nr:helix-turn-helix transcriptional regulator [Cellulomonas palmilytica]UJP41060.1 helix-turn-helix transcriptional regulator [Cellulomonas palmilytica]
MSKARIDAAALQNALEQARLTKGLSWRQVAAESGVTPSLLSRLRNGYKPDADGFMTLVTWLGLPAEDFLIEEGEARAASEPELTVRLAPLLRASKDLEEEDVAMLQELIQATLRRAAVRRQERG